MRRSSNGFQRVDERGLGVLEQNWARKGRDMFLVVGRVPVAGLLLILCTVLGYCVIR